jgi:hypothetical protein
MFVLQCSWEIFFRSYETASPKNLLSSKVRNIREELLEIYILEGEANMLFRNVEYQLERDVVSVPE